MDIRAGSVLTETEEPAVFGNFQRTETETEPISMTIGNRTRTGTEIWEPRLPEMSVFGKFHRKIVTKSSNMCGFDEIHSSTKRNK